MKLGPGTADVEVRPELGGKVWAQFALGGGVRVSVTMIAADAAKLGRALTGAARAARDEKGTKKATRIAARLLGKAAR